MRFIHTADWHLGRSFHNVSLLDDQHHALSQIVDLARDSSADALVVAGDIYDRAVPPPDAVSLLDHVLGELVVGLKIPVIIIAGNHDSADRLNFGSRLLARASCHIFGRLNGTVDTVILEDKHGPVHFLGLPYAEPSVVRERTGQSDLHNHDQAFSYLASTAAGHIPGGERSVLVAHCFAAGGSESESERPLSIGGAGSVSLSCFSPFNYTALGHLHRPQQSAETVHYSGSLMKYSFSEIGHQKSVNLVEIDGAGSVNVERNPIQPKRDLRMIEGTLKELLEGPAKGESAEDYLLVRLQDKQAILDPIGKIREIYPNVLHLERPALARAALETGFRPKPGQGDRELFSAFFEQVTGEALSEKQGKTLVNILEELQLADREASR